jgi:hypothetical protein
VNHFVADIDRCAKHFDGAFYDLDCTIDARAETAGIGKQDIHWGDYFSE